MANIDLKKIANPYTAFAISWALCLFLYSLGWSGLFPPIKTQLFIFLAVLIVIFGITGFFFNKIPFPEPRIARRINYRYLFIFNVCLYSLNFLFSGIPLLSGTRQDDFGVPTIIVIATTLNGFTSVYGFYLFLLTRKKVYLLYVVVCFLLFALAFSRGNIMMSMVTMFFLWMNVSAPRLNFKKLLGIVGGVLVVMYVFGLAGNIRTINEIKQQNPKIDDSYNSDVIEGLGGASDGFRNSIVPGEFFWTYLYITSPLSNLQYDINKNSPDVTVKGLSYVFIDEILFDAVSKRIDDVLSRKRADPDLLVEQLTVPTTLTNSYNYAGWWGMVFFIIIFWSFPWIYAVLILKNPFGLIGISTLCTAYFFSIFDNMLILTGLTFQILYPLLFSVLDRVNFKLNLKTTEPDASHN